MERFILVNQYSPEEREILLNLARSTIAYGLQNHAVMPIDIYSYSENLQKIHASFVTLQIHKKLRGCIGSLQAYQPLIKDIVHNSYSAAFLDPRFHPLTRNEFNEIDIHISVLSEPQPMQFKSEEDLISQLHPGTDGLILSDNNRRGTFLPSVWESLPEPKIFLAHLKLKAGLPPNHWSDTIKVERYTAELIP